MRILTWLFLLAAAAYLGAGRLDNAVLMLALLGLTLSIRLVAWRQAR